MCHKQIDTKMLNQLPKATTRMVKEAGLAKVHTLVAPDQIFANATHIIELPEEMVLIDGQFFAQYGAEFKELANSLKKPISRYYVTHDHPDHYLGMGDAFKDVPVYALPEIRDSITKNGPNQLKEKQQQMGSLIAHGLVVPAHVVEIGEEVIGGVRFVFERILDTEAPSMLVVKLPELGVVIAQDIIYHNTHAFITGSVKKWRASLRYMADQVEYQIFLPGHGMPADKASIDNAIAYLSKVDQIMQVTEDAGEYKQLLLAAYPHYGGSKLIDIYLPILFPKK